jgi:hypothetical protein
MDQRSWPGGALTGVGHTGALVHHFSPRKRLEEEGGTGKLTTASNGSRAVGFGRSVMEGGSGRKSSPEESYGARKIERSGGVSCGGE